MSADSKATNSISWREMKSMKRMAPNNSHINNEKEKNFEIKIAVRKLFRYSPSSSHLGALSVFDFLKNDGQK